MIVVAHVFRAAGVPVLRGARSGERACAGRRSLGLGNGWPGALAGGMLALAISAAGCGTKAAATQRVFQGVIEQDERMLAFEVPGRVRSIEVQRGDLVEEGRVLAVLDDRLATLACRARREDEASLQAELALLQAGARPEETASLAADLQAARAQEELALKTKARMESLHQNSSIGRAEVDRADSEYTRVTSQREALQQRLRATRNGARPEEIARAQARAESAAAAVALEEERLARHTLRASGVGRVIDVNLKTGEFAAAGAPAVTIAEVRHPYAEIFVPQGELAGIRVGTTAELKVDAEPAAFRGVVEHISPRTEFTPRYLFSEHERPYLVVRVRVRIDDPHERLNAGVPAFVSFAP
jgi:HlyD family secretion protein